MKQISPFHVPVWSFMKNINSVVRLFGMILSFAALEMLVEISNMRASLLSAYDQVKKDMETATK